MSKHFKRKSLSERSPHIAAQWDYEKNNEKTPNEIYVMEERDQLRKVIKRRWICHNCGHRWQASIQSREKNTFYAKQGKCGRCSGLRTSFGQEAFTVSFIYLLKHLGLKGTVGPILYDGRKELDIAIQLAFVRVTKIFSFEYDSYYFHIKRIAQDLEKNIETYDDYYMIRGREVGLPTLNDDNNSHTPYIQEIPTPRFVRNQLNELNKAILSCFEYFLKYLHSYSDLTKDILDSFKGKIALLKSTFRIQDFEKEITKRIKEHKKKLMVVYPELGKNYSALNKVDFDQISFKENVVREWDCPACCRPFSTTTNVYVTHYEQSKNKKTYTGCPYCNKKTIILCQSFGIVYRNTQTFNLVKRGIGLHGWDIDELYTILPTSEKEFPIACECGYGEIKLELHKISNLTKLNITNNKIIKSGRNKGSACPDCENKNKQAKYEWYHKLYLNTGYSPNKLAFYLREEIGENVSESTIIRAIKYMEGR